MGVPGWGKELEVWGGVIWVQETWNPELAMQTGCGVLWVLQTSSSSSSTAPVSRASTDVLVPGTAESLGALRLQLV